jgi:hypothetical protein
MMLDRLGDGMCHGQLLRAQAIALGSLGKRALFGKYLVQVGHI